MLRTLFTALSAFALAGSAFAQDISEAVPETETPMPSVEEATTVQSDDIVLGETSAEDELVIYASVTCGHCGQWFTQEWPGVKSELIETGRLRVAVREFPTAPEQVSVVGFMIAACADESRWYEALEAQFEGQDATQAARESGKGQDRFTELAAYAGIEGEAEIEACFARPELFERIEGNMRRGIAADIAGVPAFFLNGKAMGPKHNLADIAAALGE